LLLAVPQHVLKNLLARAEEVGEELWVVGQVMQGNHIEVLE
jgi:hypothetical protein